MLYNIIKRLIDFTLSLIAIIILLPLFIPIIVLLKFTAEGEVFYFQERIGFKNKKFKIWKFSTMLKNSMYMVTGSISLRDDYRVTSIGKFLRKSKINELPQLVNILKGDISLVGPRPLVVKTFDAYSNDIKRNIYNVKPGLTGVGSIYFRDEEQIISIYGKKNPHKYYVENIAPTKGKLEIWYQQNKSIYLDIKLIIFTLIVVAFPETNIVKKFYKNLMNSNNFEM